MCGYRSTRSISAIVEKHVDELLLTVSADNCPFFFVQTIVMVGTLKFLRSLHTVRIYIYLNLRCPL